ncbi:MAG: hypothetical protein P8Z30_05520 [Acidobacteriota bacterium]
MEGVMSVEDFDRAVMRILEQEFVGVLDMGLLPEEALLPVVAGMRCSLCKAFPGMSAREIRFHLQSLRQECRDTANSIYALADAGYWN